MVLQVKRPDEQYQSILKAKVLQKEKRKKQTTQNTATQYRDTHTQQIP